MQYQTVHLVLPSPSTCSTVSNRTIFDTGRDKVVDCVFTETLRTRLSLLLQRTSIILPNVSRKYQQGIGLASICDASMYR